MEIVPLGPGFAAELRGVTLAEIAAAKPGPSGTISIGEPSVALIAQLPTRSPGPQGSAPADA